MSKEIRRILVVNAGSSSLKFMLFDMQGEVVMAKGQIERIGMKGSLFTYESGAYKASKVPTEAPNHAVALNTICAALVEPEHGCIASLNEIHAVGHRMVHGGAKYSASVLMTDEVVKQVEDLIPMAPLHNPGSLQGLEGCKKVLGDVPHVGVFDTAFHQTMPAESYLYALPLELHEKYGVRKYGFHGTSHRFVTRRAAEVLGKPLDELNIITCHLGNGSSISAIRNGKVFDTSMGMTPLAGVMMGTRCGDIDPEVIIYLMKQGLSADEIDNMMNKQGGIQALANTGSSDMRELCAAALSGENPQARVALDKLLHTYVMYVGGYYALLGKVDAIILTGGIGENSMEARGEFLERLSGLGVKLDPERNTTTRFGKEGPISTDDSPLPVYVLPTNEELMIARETYEVATR